MMYNERKMKNAGKGARGNLGKAFDGAMSSAMDPKKMIMKKALKPLKKPGKAALDPKNAMPYGGPAEALKMPGMLAKAKKGGMGPMKKDYIKKMLKKKARMGGKMKTSTSMGAE